MDTQEHNKKSTGSFNISKKFFESISGTHLKLLIPPILEFRQRTSSRLCTFDTSGRLIKTQNFSQFIDGQLSPIQPGPLINHLLNRYTRTDF